MKDIIWCCTLDHISTISNVWKQVRANNDAAFQCKFLFNIFFILWMLSVFIELYYLIPIDFTWFCYRFRNFYNMVTDMWMDKQMDNIMDRQTDWWADRSINGWTCNIHAKNDDVPIDFAIFTKALPPDRRTKGPTDRPTDGHTLL